MSIPKNITRENLISAINKIDKEGVPNMADSQYYDVGYNGKLYPPKLVVSYANIFANGSLLDRRSFNGGINTQAFKLLEKHGFNIINKSKFPNIKLYDIHGASTIENYNTLITTDNKFFYWDHKRFKKYSEGDVVFWVNRAKRVALFTKIDSVNVKPTFENGRNLIEDEGYKLSATAQDSKQFETFYRFKIIDKIDLKDSWNYSNIIPFNGQTMAIILYEPKVKDPEKKIEKIKDIKEIFEANIEVEDLLNSVIELLSGKLTLEKNEPKVWFVTQGSTFQKDRGMKFLWAPKTGQDGNSRFYWKNVYKIKKGDIIFNYSDKELKGVSLAENDGFESENEFSSSPWEANGYKVDIKLISLDPVITNETFVSKKGVFEKILRAVKNKPFNSNGGVNQGYLYEFSKEAGRLIRDLYGRKFGNEIIDNFFDKVVLKQDNKKNIEMSFEPIHFAIKTKPFILLAGLSGTGKSRLARTLAYKTCAKDVLRKDTKKPGNFEIIPVRPNWHDSSELMGYISRINGEKYITTSFLKFIAKAWKNIEIPFFLCLDEMNLAPVEQYFAEYLSIMETRQVQNGIVVSDYLLTRSNFENQNLYSEVLKDLKLDNDDRFVNGIGIPVNLIVVGTVNMDETTHSFSRKVLDRAMTFEMNEVDLKAGLDGNINDWAYPETYIKSEELIGDYTAGSEVVNLFSESAKVIDFLLLLNKELEGTPFKIAYRVRDEFLIYCYYASLNQSDSNWLDIALDNMTSMKILSRIEGDETKTGKVLESLQNVLTSNFVKSNAKLKEMSKRLSDSGYTSFWT